MSPTLSDGLAALATQAAVTGVVLLLFCQSDAKGQAIGSLVVAAFLGSIAAHYVSPLRQPLECGLARAIRRGRARPKEATVVLPEHLYRGPRR